jgi:hypothetical protein
MEQKGTELRELTKAVVDHFRDLDMLGVPQSGPHGPVCKPWVAMYGVSSVAPSTSG